MLRGGLQDREGLRSLWSLPFGEHVLCIGLMGLSVYPTNHSPAEFETNFDGRGPVGRPGSRRGLILIVTGNAFRLIRMNNAVEKAQA